MIDFTLLSFPAQLLRWENVIRVLTNLSPHQREKHWNMSKFGLVTECGTIGCAAGHCAMDPWFQHQGFNFDFYQDGDINNCVMPSKCRHFFGARGTDQIFMLGLPRSVERVTREVQQFIDIAQYNRHFD